jgi:hypothetical protein
MLDHLHLGAGYRMRLSTSKKLHYVGFYADEDGGSTSFDWDDWDLRFTFPMPGRPRFLVTAYLAQSKMAEVV